MKCRLKHIGTILTLVSPLFIGGCSFADAPENREPLIKLLPVEDITRTSAKLSAEVTGDDNDLLTSISFVYGDPFGNTITTEEIPVAKKKSVCEIKGLLPGTIYNYMATAKRYSAEIMTPFSEFSTVPNDTPTIGATEIIASNPTSIIIRIKILNDGGENITLAGCTVTELSTGRRWSENLPTSVAIPGCRELILTVSSLKPHNHYTLTPFAENTIGRVEGETLHYETEDAYLVETPGKLNEILKDLSPETISLNISGPLNGDDFRHLRQLLSSHNNKIIDIDLSGVSICSGGGPYEASLYTVDNVISSGLFSDLSKLERIVLPNTAIRIMNDAFRNCSRLKSLAIPPALKSLVTSYGCSSLETIIVSEANMNFSSIDGVLYDISKSQLLWFPQGRKELPDFPETLQLIGENAFRGCSFQSFTLPSSVTGIERGAFSDSDVHYFIMSETIESLGSYIFENAPLKQLKILAEIPPVINEDTFKSGSILIFDECKLLVPAGSINIFRNHPIWGNFKEIEAF